MEDFRWYSRNRNTGFPLLTFIRKLEDLNHPMADKFSALDIGNFVSESTKNKFFELLQEFKRYLQKNKESMV